MFLCAANGMIWNGIPYYPENTFLAVHIYTEHFHQSCIVKEIVTFNNNNVNKKWSQKKKCQRKEKIKGALLFNRTEENKSAFYSFFFFNKQLKLCSWLQTSWTWGMSQNGQESPDDSLQRPPSWWRKQMPGSSCRQPTGSSGWGWASVCWTARTWETAFSNVDYE